MRLLYIFIAFSIIGFNSAFSQTDKLQSADVIFITYQSGEPNLRKGKFNFCGIIMYENDTWYVYYAEKGIVKRKTFDEFTDMSEDKKFVVKRFTSSDYYISFKALMTMETFLKNYYSKEYEQPHGIVNKNEGLLFEIYWYSIGVYLVKERKGKIPPIIDSKYFNVVKT